MDYIEAIEKRISCRAYKADPLEPEVVCALEAEIARANKEAGLHFQLYGPRANGTAIDLSPKMFAGAPPYYAALVGPAGPEPEERLGYYGERLVLLATRLSLGTCWVASTYDASTTRADIAEGERLHDVVPIGYAPEKMPLKQRTIRAGLRRRDKKLDALWSGPMPLAEAPEWIQAGVIAAQKGPSAVNMQPYMFVQDEPGAPVSGVIPAVKHSLDYTDLGIAKLHFELAAAACGVIGQWEWGSGGAFVVKAGDSG